LFGGIEMSFPKKLKSGLIIRRLDGETLVYNKATLRASCLGRLAANVWDRCDGRTSVSEITKAIPAGHVEAIDEQTIWRTIQSLEESGLLEQAVEPLVDSDRRRALKALSIGAAAASITTIVVPSVADAASCAPSGAPCNLANPGACCSLTCINNAGGATCL
jgi:hypothetical protein